MNLHQESPISISNLVEEAGKIANRARALQEVTERDRRVPDEIIIALRETGLLRVRQPKRWGGAGLGAADHYQLVEILSRGCASTGWVYSVLAGHADDIASQFHEEVHEEVWSKDPHGLASSSFFPNGWAEPSGDGYVLSGEFPFSSGCDHADWAIVGSIAPDCATGPGPLLFLVPMKDFSIRDNWFTRGLAGTGSKTLIAEALHIPRHRTAPFPMMVGSTAPFALSSVLAGAARGVIDAFIAHLQKKHPKDSLKPVGGENLQMLIGACWAEIDAAWTLIQSDVRSTEAHLARDGVLPRDITIRNRAHNTLTTKLILDALDRIYAASGSSMIFEDSLISRLYHDVKAGSQHASINQFSGARDAGFMLLNPNRSWSYPLPS
ncbi:acyl-CoA dehydrogenase family protein [Agrobacterium rosae]|jgi:3-hydroxy-9,10-secoandrosta-1,3,5(10)-triene-9,17-dione monooxygenase|uniref:acyl-CoA dehydrogenase family protein n=1 Tax=Agrobacterium rosae TaxID=1972867 RepID=UPI003A80394E